MMMMNEESVKGKIVLEGTLVLDAPLLIGTRLHDSGKCARHASALRHGSRV